MLSYGELDGTWSIMAVNGDALTPGKGNVPTLTFDTNTNRLGGSTGCNRVMGNIERGNDNTRNIYFGQTATTRMACPDMDTERNILEALNATKTFGRLPNGNAAFYDANGTAVMELRKEANGANK